MKNSSFSGKRLKEQRKNLGYTQAQIAEKCGISTRMWGDYERDISQPKSEQLFRFEKAGIDIYYVMHGERVQPGAVLAELAKPGDALRSLKQDLAPALSDADTPLSSTERDLIALFRAATAADRDMILHVARRAEKRK